MNEFIAFCKKIDLPDNVVDVVCSCYLNNKDKILHCMQIFLTNKERKNLQFKDKLFSLTLTIALAIKVKEEYVLKGIEDSVYYDTMKDITIWTNEYFKQTNKIGLENVNWIFLHLTLSIFKIGRLQFQPTKVPFVPLLFYCRHKKMKIPFNKQCINIHIPRGEKLKYEECIDSIKQSKCFFSKYFPNIDLNNYMIISWLVDPRLSKIIDHNSNIYKFQSMFNVVRVLSIKKDVIYYVFGCKKIKNKKTLPEDTSLQRAIKKHFLSNRSLGIGLGFLDLKIHDN